MARGILLAVFLLASGCTDASQPVDRCASVFAIKAHPEACVGRSIRVQAYLVSTRHGAYLVDTPGGNDVLSAAFSESRSDKVASAALLEKLDRANVGHPDASIHGVFEGRLTIDGRGNPRELMISAQVH